MIPQRALTATLEISTGSMIFSSRPPAYTGENLALDVDISLMDSGDAYTLATGAMAEMYLYWPGTVLMSEAVELTASGSHVTGSMPASLMAVPGCPLLVIKITDTNTGALIVAAATPIQITNVLGEQVISTRPPTPSEVVYVGRSPYINTSTGTWMEWDPDAGEYVDTETVARGLPATFTAQASTLPPGSAATASITGTATDPVLNLGIPSGADGAVLSVNGQTGAVVLDADDIDSGVTGTGTSVEDDISALSGQIGDVATALGNTEAGLAIIVSGDTCAVAVPAGGYAYVKNNTHGLSEGLYRNKTSSAFPTSGGTANSTVFEAVSDGISNALNAKITPLDNTIKRKSYQVNSKTLTIPDGTAAIIAVASSNGNGYGIFFVEYTADIGTVEISKGSNLSISQNGHDVTLSFTDGVTRYMDILVTIIRGNMITL